MERHQHTVVQILSIWGRFGYKLLENQSFSQQAWWFSVGNVPPLGTKRYPLPLIAFMFFSHVNIEQQECCVIFSDFSGFVWTFLCIYWVFNAFMCIIQIWTTCACSNAYKFIKNQIFFLGGMLRSHARNGNEFQTPWHRWLSAKQWDAWFLNSIISKRNSRDLACYLGAASTCRGTNFVPFGAGLGICFSQTGVSQNKHDGFW